MNEEKKKYASQCIQDVEEICMKNAREVLKNPTIEESEELTQECHDSIKKAREACMDALEIDEATLYQRFPQFAAMDHRLRDLDRIVDIYKEEQKSNEN